MSYDAIIIGGGLGGLAAGAALSKKGKKVLILEQHTTVGGLAAGFTRKGYYFDSGMSRANAMSIMGPLKPLGIFNGDDFAPHRSAHNIEGRAFTCGSVKEYFEQISESFTDDREALGKLYREQVEKRAALLETMMGGGAGKLAILMKLPAMIREASRKEDFNGVLMRYLGDGSRAYQFLCERWEEVNYRGRMNAFMRIGKIYTQMRNAYPVGGFQGMCDKVAGYVKANGGEISLKSKVERILVEGGRCTGVEVTRGGRTKTLRASNVISAVDLGRAFFGLIGEEHIPAPWAERLRKSELGASIPILYLGLDIPAEKLRERFLGMEELMYYPKVKRCGGCAEDEGYYRDAAMVLHSPRLVNPALAPAGKSGVQVYMQCAPKGWLENWGIEDGKKTDRYSGIKKMVMEQSLASLENVIPELADRSIIEVCELGTPYTIERFTGSSGGCACGFTMDGDTVNPRVRGKFFDRLPGIANLYFCGQQACWPGAAGSALSSGMHAADLVE
jgi:all-trans-retinol 13,14-reductase